MQLSAPEGQPDRHGHRSHPGVSRSVNHSPINLSSVPAFPAPNLLVLNCPSDVSSLRPTDGA